MLWKRAACFFPLNLQLIQFWSDVFTFQQGQVNPAADFVGFSLRSYSGLGLDLRQRHFSLTVIKNYTQKKNKKTTLGITLLVKIFKIKQHHVQHWRSAHTPSIFIPFAMRETPKRKVTFLFQGYFAVCVTRCNPNQPHHPKQSVGNQHSKLRKTTRSTVVWTGIPHASNRSPSTLTSWFSSL